MILHFAVRRCTVWLRQLSCKNQPRYRPPISNITSRYFSEEGATEKPKKKKKAKSGKGAEDSSAVASENENILDHKQFDAFIKATAEADEATKKIEWSEEEKKEHFRIGRTFNIQSFVRHQRLAKDTSDKIWLMQEALRALPPNLQESARVIDEEPPPSDRPWAMWSTPPIKGFDDTPYAKAEDGDTDGEEEYEDTESAEKSSK